MLDELLSEDDGMSDHPAQPEQAEENEEEFENEADLIGGNRDEEEDEPEGEDLMGENMEE